MAAAWAVAALPAIVCMRCRVQGAIELTAHESSQLAARKIEIEALYEFYWSCVRRKTSSNSLERIVALDLACAH